MLKNVLNSLRGANRASGAGNAESPSFLPVYERQFAPHLGEREAGFRIMLQSLEALAQGREEPLLIVETGSMRQENDWGAGQSTLLWAAFAAVHNCEVHTVDLNAQTTALVRRVCGDAIHAHTQDSVAFLYAMACAPARRQIDLLYLDSFDFDPEQPFPSAMHHVLELISIRPCLGPGSIVAIDDNFYSPEGDCTGKGYLAMQWFRHLQIPCLHKGYQLVWQF